jgi:protein TonB
VVVEEMPKYPGGDKAMMEFIYSNIKYPEEAKEKSIQGRVILRFAVMATGKVENVSVLKHVDPLLDEEAKRVVESLPNWIPGRQGGKPVNVWYSVPVTFQLK